MIKIEMLEQFLVLVVVVRTIFGAFERKSPQGFSRDNPASV